MRRLETSEFTFFVTVSEPKDGGSGVWWFPLAMEALAKAAGISKQVVLNCSWGTCWSNEPERKSYLVGIKVHGFVKNPSRAKWLPKGKAMQLTAAAFDPKTKKICSGTSELGDSDTLPCLYYFRHPDGVQVEFDDALQAKILAAAGGGNVAVAKDPSERPFAHKKTVFASALTPDGKYVVSSGMDRRLCVWDASSGQPVKAVTAAGPGLKFLSGLAISPDGRVVAAGPAKIKIYALPDLTVVKEIEGHPKGEIQDLRFSRSGKLLASCSAMNVQGADNSVAVWEVASGRCLGRWKFKTNPFRVLFSNDEKTLVGTARGSYEGGDAHLFSIDLSTNVLTKRVVPGSEDGFMEEALAFNRDNSFIVVTDECLFLDPVTLHTQRTLALPSSNVSVFVSLDGTRAICIDDGKVATTSLETGKTTTKPWKVSGDVRRLTWTQGVDEIVATVDTRSVTWNPTTGAIVGEA